MRLNGAGVRRFFSGVKEFQKNSGVSSNFKFLGVSKKKWGVRVSGVVLQGGVFNVLLGLRTVFGWMLLFLCLYNINLDVCRTLQTGQMCFEFRRLSFSLT